MSRVKVQQPLEGAEELQQRLAAWRQGRISGQAMPEELWSAAAELARRHSVYAVARCLGLEFNKLKSRVEGRALGPKKRSGRRARKQRDATGSMPELGGFIELHASQLFGEVAGASEAVLELFAPDGARMRLSLRAPAALDLPGLVAAFTSRRERCCR